MRPWVPSLPTLGVGMEDRKGEEGREREDMGESEGKVELE